MPSTFWNKLFFSKWTLLIELGLVIILGISFFQSVRTQQHIAKEIGLLEKDLDALTQEQGILKERQFAASSDAFIETQAKQKLNLKNAGETAVIFYEDTKQQTNQPQTDTSPQQQDSNIKKWIRYFFE
ncbi:MAG TPA: septum formation initiator family protein [Patescibacteria group bacterium]|nr:septum formation initiator family protein [Patescibacteria group bacterium]